MGLPHRMSIIAGIIGVGFLVVVAATLMGRNANGNEVSLFKSGGDVDIGEALDGASITTMGGNIHLGTVNGSARLKTFGGNINVDSATGSIEATTMAGNISVHIQDKPQAQKAETVELNSNGGEITLYLPRQFGATIDVSLAYTDNQREVFHIADDVGLKQTASSDWSIWRGTPRKYINGSGSIGDGRNHIVIRTVNGNVTVKQTGA